MIENTYENIWHLIGVMREYEEKNDTNAVYVMQETISYWIGRL